MGSENEKTHEYWMRIALEEAEKAMEEGEIPIGGVLVADGELVRRTQTSVVRHGSIAAHGELLAILESKGDIWSYPRPIILYTTLEPCAMCLGAMSQAYIDVVVYGMKAAPDGGVFLADTMRQVGQHTPEIIGGILEQESVALFRRWNNPPDHPAYPYVQALLAPYERAK